jgi:DNA-binding beta-propeller fold protein YncE
MKRISVILSCLLVMLMVSCKPEDPVIPEPVSIGKGVFVINEGSFTNGGSTLTFYNPEMDTVANHLFYRANNGAVLGDTGQSLALIDGKLYIVVNNSNYIYKVDANTIVCDTTQPYMLTDFYSPRYMHVVNPEKAYVSDIVGSDLWIVNPKDMTHTGTIQMGKPTETMVQVGQEVYVTNWSNYYCPTVDNNTVQVVDVNNDVKVAEITVGKEPNGMVVDKNNMVWVLCEGAVWTEEAQEPTLWRIDPMTKQAVIVASFDPYEGVMNLAIDPTGTYLYYFRDNAVRRVNIDSPDTEDSFAILAEDRNFYKIAVDPNNGDIYVSDAKAYTIEGSVYRYSSDGVLLSSFEAGICPGFMLFN